MQPADDAIENVEQADAGLDDNGPDNGGQGGPGPQVYVAPNGWYVDDAAAAVEAQRVEQAIADGDQELRVYARLLGLGAFDGAERYLYDPVRDIVRCALVAGRKSYKFFDVGISCPAAHVRSPRLADVRSAVRREFPGVWRRCAGNGAGW